MRLGVVIALAVAMVAAGTWWLTRARESPGAETITLVPKAPPPPPATDRAPTAGVVPTRSRTHVAKDSPNREACLACHPRGADDAAIAAVEVGELCAGCHAKPHEDKSHSTEVPLPLGMTTWLPLAPDGYITCATCHDPHGQATKLLRGGGTPADLCRSCHVGY